MSDHDALLAQYRATVDCFNRLLAIRFAMATAVAFLALLAAPLGDGMILLPLLAVPLWIIELRNRSMHWAYRSLGLELEDALRRRDGAEAVAAPSGEAVGTFFSAVSPAKPVEIRILFFRVRVQPRGLFSRVVNHTVGIDLLYLGPAVMVVVLMILREMC